MSELDQATRIADEPKNMTVTVPVTPAMLQAVRTVGAAVEANEWEVDSNDMAQLAAEQRTTWARRIDQVKAMEKDFMEPAKTFMNTIKEKCQKWFAPALADLEEGRDILGKKLLSWEGKERARIAAERERIEAEQRKIRQEAEAKAAAERARAEEQVREQQRREQEAQEALRKAQAEGNAKAAAAAAAAAAKANEAAAAARENAEANARRAEIEATAKQAAFDMPQAVKIEGSTIKENWIAVLGEHFTEDSALVAICKAIADGRTDLLPILKVDTAPRGALNKLASALRGQMRVPGYVARDVGKIAGARK